MVLMKVVKKNATPCNVLFIVSVLILKNVHLQPNKCRGELKELRMLCAEDEQGRTCWMTAFRLFKVNSDHTTVYTPWRSYSNFG